jgi:hypothetical protein
MSALGQNRKSDFPVNLPLDNDRERATSGFDDAIWLLMKAAPTTMVKDRGWSLTITTRGSSGDGYTNGIAKPVLRQLLRGALRRDHTLADVRYSAHFGLNSDIARLPKRASCGLHAAQQKAPLLNHLIGDRKQS